MFSEHEEMFDHQGGLCYVCDLPLMKDENENMVPDYHHAPEMSKSQKKMRLRETIEIHHHPSSC